jgi:hypothetical protein
MKPSRCEWGAAPEPGTPEFCEWVRWAIGMKIDCELITEES